MGLYVLMVIMCYVPIEIEMGVGMYLHKMSHKLYSTS